MSIFNYRWKHNNTATKLTIPVKKFYPYPFSLFVLYMVGLGFIVYELQSLSLDVIPQL